MGTLTTDRPNLAVDHYLRGLLADGPVRAIDAIAEAEANGFSRSSTVRSRRRIGALIRRVGFGPGSYVEWSLPPAGPASLARPFTHTIPREELPHRNVH